MKIETFGDGGEHEAIGKACQRAYSFAPECNAIIYIKPRSTGGSDPVGWLEYGILFRNTNGINQMYIGMIQRSPGAEYEFHS